jgi:hypothetical protein
LNYVDRDGRFLVDAGESDPSPSPNLPANSGAPIGSTLYVHNYELIVVDRANVHADVVGRARLNSRVVFLGFGGKNREFVRIGIPKAVGGVCSMTTGYVMREAFGRQNLSTEPWVSGPMDDGKPIDTQAFPSSGAATKA